jgi:hypothetical protein
MPRTLTDRLHAAHRVTHGYVKQARSPIGFDKLECQMEYDPRMVTYTGECWPSFTIPASGRTRAEAWTPPRGDSATKNYVSQLMGSITSDGTPPPSEARK